MTDFTPHALQQVRDNPEEFLIYIEALEDTALSVVRYLNDCDQSIRPPDTGYLRTLVEDGISSRSPR